MSEDSAGGAALSFQASDTTSFPTAPSEDSEEVRQEMRELALSSLYYLCKVVLGYTKLRDEPHGDLCDFIDQIEQARDAGRFEFNRSAIFMPRDTYKTTIATIGRAIQRGLKDPNTRGLILTDTGSNAVRFGIEISNQFKYNTLLQWLFPEVIPENFNTARWSAKEMVLRRSAPWREPTFDMMGAGGGIETRHYDWILADDLVTETHIHSDAEMDKLIKWIGGLEPLLVNDVESAIDFVGSRKKKSDAYEHILKYYDIPGRRIKLGPHAVLRGNLAIYSRSIIEDGKIIFPYDAERKSGISRAYVERMKSHDPERFWAQLANNPRSSGRNIFEKKTFNEAFWSKNRDIECWQEGNLILNTSPWAMDRFILFDPSVAENKGSSMQALIVIAKGTHPFRFVLESHIGHFPPDEAIELLLELDRRWRPDVVSIEERGFQGSIKYWLEEKTEAEGIPYPPVLKYPPEGSVRAQWAKKERIKGLQPSFRAGLWWFVGGFEAHSELVDQLEFYPNTRWDDGPDCLAQSLEYLPDAWDEVAAFDKKSREENMLSVRSKGRHYSFDDEPEWNESEFLSRFSASGYGFRLPAEA